MVRGINTGKMEEIPVAMIVTTRALAKEAKLMYSSTMSRTSHLKLGRSVIQPEKILPRVFVTPTTEMRREAWAREKPRL